MIQLLVVDDYPDQVEAILSILPLEELGIGEAFRAYSGMEALEVLRRTPVDIVITDIKMPGMSGLELISRIRETSGSTKCILLSGYAEFEYAKQAITLQTSYYLTKPVLTAELISIMRSVIASLKAEWEEISSRQRALRTFQEHLPLLRGELLNQLLLDKRIPPAILEEKLHMLELPFALQDRVYLLLVRLEEDFAELDDYDL
ncbi:MAG: response regulator, partial [Paenibacillaceae bacterium]|nr:response regulator [Paenibacillaceae bacterium]